MIARPTLLPSASIAHPPWHQGDSEKGPFRNSKVRMKYAGPLRLPSNGRRKKGVAPTVTFSNPNR